MSMASGVLDHCQHATDSRKRIRSGRKVLQQRSGTRVGYHGTLYLACVSHVFSAASLERNQSGISETRVASEYVSGQGFEHDENCAAVSHAVV
jgi:hypothetical protein